MMKVCHLITSLDVGGAEMFLFRLLAAVDRRRFDSSVFSLIEPGIVGRRMEEQGIRVQTLALNRGAASPLAVARLTRHLRRERPGLLMTWLYHADLLGLIAGTLAGIRSIAWNLRASDMDMSCYRTLSGRTLWLCTKLSRLPRAVVVNSERGRAYHSGIGYRPREWVLIRNGVDSAQFMPDAAARALVREELGLRHEDLAIGLVARYDPMKDHANFLAAARRVAENSDSVHFVLAGAGIGRDNMQLAQALGRAPSAGRVHLLGERHDMPRIYAALDIACSSSRSEAFPNTVAEAMACGVVCVVTDTGDSAAIVGDTGLVVPPGDPEALSLGLLKAIAMGAAGRHALGLAARERIIQNFSLGQAVSAYEDFFSRLES